MILGIAIGCALVAWIVFVAVATWPGPKWDRKLKAANKGRW